MPPRSVHPLAGYLAVAGSAVLFSAKGVLIKMGYRHGVDAITFMTLRMLFSLPFLLAMAATPLLRRGVSRPLSRGEWAGVAGMGFLGYYLASLLDLVGLKYVGAGTERMILFVYPTLVVLFSAWLFRKPVSRAMLLPLGMSYAGIALSFGGEAGEGAFPRLGTLLVFMSAVSYALFLIVQDRLVHRVDLGRLTAYAMLFSTVATLLQFLLFRPLSDLRQPGSVYLLALTVAVFCTVVPVWLLGYGIKAVGADRAAILSSVGPVSTFLLAGWVLGEEAGALKILGLVLVLAGGLQLGMSKRDAPAKA